MLDLNFLLLEWVFIVSININLKVSKIWFDILFLTGYEQFIVIFQLPFSKIFTKKSQLVTKYEQKFSYIV